MKKMIYIAFAAAIFCGGCGISKAGVGANSAAASADAAIASAPHHSPNTTDANVPSTPSNHVLPPVQDKNHVVVQADYSDSVLTLDELKQNADLIVYGKITSQMQYSQSAAASTFSVDTYTKGSAPDVITIFQLGELSSQDVLTPGQSYLLFLGKQEDGQEDTYFIKGGHQGEVRITEGKLHFKDGLMQKDYEKQFGATTKEGIVSQLDLLDEWLDQ